MSDQEIINVVAGHQEGRTIQARDKGSASDWKDCVNNAPMWNFNEVDYRIKPALRSWWIFEKADGGITIINYKPCNPNWIRVQEVAP